MYDLLVIAAVVWFGWLGSQAGLVAAGIAALELLACVVFGTVLHETVSDLLDNGVRFATGMQIYSWIALLTQGLLVWGTFAALRWWLHRGEELGDESGDGQIAPLADRLGGAVAGGLGGLVLAGAGLVTLSMLPILSGLKPAPQRMYLDAGRLVLRAAGAFAGGFHEGRSLPLEGEPPARPSSMAARMTSEPWFDADADGAPGESDRYSDVDGSGGFSKDLYYVDVDRDGVRRVGLIDKYLAACWDASLNRNDREREDLKKPKPKPVPPGRPATAPPAAPQPPPAGPPADKPADGGDKAEPPGEGTPANGDEPPPPARQLPTEDAAPKPEAPSTEPEKPAAEPEKPAAESQDAAARD